MANPLLDGIGKVIGKLSDQVQGRIERLKNEKNKLEDELTSLETGVCTDEKVKRASAIVKRIDEINSILSNKASD